VVNSKGNKKSEFYWQTIREKWTVTLAMAIIIVALIVVITILLYSLYQNDATLVDKILVIFNAITMAVLGYLFGYVPTKASEENVKREREITEEQIGALKKAINNYEQILEKNEKKIKEYEIITALYEAK